MRSEPVGRSAAAPEAAVEALPDVPGTAPGTWQETPAGLRARRTGRLRLYLLALGTVALWGASFPLTKVALEGLGPLAIAFVRWTISTLALVGWLAVARRLPLAGRFVHREYRTIWWVALTGITLFYALENFALRFTSATNAGILANLTSVFIALLAAVWLHERVGRRGWLAMGVAFLGAVLVSQGSGHLTFSSMGLAGDLMMLVATFFGALYSIGGKGLTERYPSDVVTTSVAAAGALFLMPLALWEGLTLALPAEVWVALIVLGLGSGALANLFWLHILSYMPASRAGIILFLVPVTSTLLAVVLLHEPFTAAMLAGGALVLAAVAVMQR
jgi:drug/metabolite transporter (DMT)-like permease